MYIIIPPHAHLPMKPYIYPLKNTLNGVKRKRYLTDSLAEGQNIFHDDC